MKVQHTICVGLHLLVDIWIAFISFMSFVPCVFLQSTYHLTYALHDTPFMTYINSYIFWHRCAILSESL